MAFSSLLTSNIDSHFL